MKFLLGLFIFVSSASAEDAQLIPIPKPFRECKVDSECVLSTRLCGCCDQVSMNKKFVKKYAALERYCKNPPPPCKCTVPAAKPKCVKNLCELVEGK